MQATDLIRWALRMSEEGTIKLIADMRDAPLTQPTSRGGNHVMWSIGHLCWIEGAVREIILGDKNPVEHWRALFSTGTTPSTDASVYPPFDEVVSTYRRLRGETLQLLDKIGEAGLDRPPKNVPPGFEEAMRTTGRALMLLSLHQMVHYGQIADARRVAGHKPLM